MAAIFSVTINAISGSARPAGLVTAAPIIAVRVADHLGGAHGHFEPGHAELRRLQLQGQSAPIPPSIVL